MKPLPSTIAILALSTAAFVAGRWSAGSRAHFPSEGRAVTPLTAVSPLPSSSAVTTPALPNATAPAAAVWSKPEWETWLARPGSALRTAALSASIELLAQSDPGRALALARSERNLVLREQLLSSVLRGWARIAPSDAVNYVYTLDDPAKRSAAMATVFSSAAASQPDEAIRLGHALFQNDPAGATGHGSSLIAALCAAGHCEAAAKLAATSGAAGPVARSILLTQAYSTWATFQPEAAARAAAALADPATRTDALNAVVSGWGQASPADLTRFVARLPPGPERIPMLGQALRQWTTLDSAAASQWVATAELGADADDGIAAVVGGGFLDPKVAAGWAGDIASPALRSQSTLNLLRNWALTDPDAARRHFETTPYLNPGDRTAAAALFAPPGSP